MLILHLWLITSPKADVLSITAIGFVVIYFINSLCNTGNLNLFGISEASNGDIFHAFVIKVPHLFYTMKINYIKKLIY